MRRHPWEIRWCRSVTRCVARSELLAEFSPGMCPGIIKHVSQLSSLIISTAVNQSEESVEK